MKSSNYWQQFVCTGKIEDYLSYVNGENSPGNGQDTEKERAGADPYAGIHMCDRNDTQTNAYRGI